MADPKPLTQAVSAGDQEAARRETERALAAGENLQAILDEMVAGMEEIGERFKRGEAFVPEMLIAARAMKTAMSILEPLLTQAGIRPRHTVILGTVRGDLHDVGKNLVAMMWKGVNFGVVDLGVDVAPESFVAAVREHGAAAVGLSALLTTTMPVMKDTIAALRANGGAGVKVLVGGAPLTRAFAESIGADGFAPDAASAVDVLRRVLGT